MKPARPRGGERAAAPTAGPNHRPVVRHLPSRADVCRRVREQVDAGTLDDLDCYLALLARAVGRGRPDAAQGILDELRAGFRPEERRS